MDSTAQLALISKAKKVFGSENIFLSFPVTPLAYQKEDLEFFSQKSGLDLLKSKANLSAFSTLVNLIPRGEAWLPTDSRFLWDEYEYVLKQGVTAASNRTTEEEIAFQTSRDYLKQPGEDETLRDSGPVRVYKQHRDAHFIAQQEYMQARASGVATEDEAEKKQWREVDEPAYLAQLENLNDEWVLEGFKNEVEAARENFLRLGAKSPVLTWAEWWSQFNPDLSSETGVDSTRIFPSSFMPSNATEKGSWRPFTLNEAEIKSLISEASDDLRNRYSIESGETSIKSINLEFSSAAIIRPWFEPQVFRSRFWRLANQSKILSNGTMPLSGDCPAYVTAVVFARHVIVQSKNKVMRPSGHKAISALRFNHAIKNQNKINLISPALLKAIRPVQMQTLKQQKPATTKVKRLQIKPQLFKQFRATALMPKFTANPGIMRRPGKARAGNKVKPALASRKMQSKAALKLQAYEFNRLKGKPVIKHVRTPAAPVGAKTDDSIYIFAFICKPIPKCPDPDHTLAW